MSKRFINHARRGFIACFLSVAVLSVPACTSTGGLSLKALTDIFVAVETADVMETELRAWVVDSEDLAPVEPVIERLKEIVEAVKGYKGSANFIDYVISKPKEWREFKQSWNDLLRFVVVYAEETDGLEISQSLIDYAEEIESFINAAELAIENGSKDMKLANYGYILLRVVAASKGVRI